MLPEFIERGLKPGLGAKNIIARELSGKLFPSFLMLPPQSFCKLDQRCFKFVIISRPHFFRSAHSSNEIGDASQMNSNRMVCDGARGCHTCELNDLGKYAIDSRVSIEFFSAPSTREIPPLQQCPSGIPDLAEWSV